jgi:hypothetical protein
MAVTCDGMGKIHRCNLWQCYKFKSLINTTIL